MTNSGQSRFHVFRWREEESVTGRNRVLRPTLDVKLGLGDMEVMTKALVDTGAPRSVFPRGVGDALALDFPLPSQADTRIHLMGRSWPAITETVYLELPPFTDLGWEATVDFVLDEGLPFALLGYEGFLNRWAVSFNGYHSYFIVEPIDSFEDRIPPDPFDELQRMFPDEYRD